MSAVHASPYSGTWYSGNREELTSLIGELFERSEARTGPCVLGGARGFVVPHAGLVYSGAVAAAAYRYVERMRPARVIILGFSHRGSAPGPLIPLVDAIRTPLGEVRIDGDLRSKLVDSGRFHAVSEQTVCDHSVEIQLPLLQKAVPDALVTPVYTGLLDSAARRAAAEALAGVLEPGTLLLASSDFTHYGREFGYQPFPSDSRVADNLSKLDHSLIDAAGSIDARLFLGSLREVSSTLCGSAPIALLLETLSALGDDFYQETLDYQASGEITGDYRHSVSYSALGYFPWESFPLNPEDQGLLLESARATLGGLLDTGERRPVYPVRHTPGLSRRTGVFVSIHANGELRGCVGGRSGVERLFSGVPEMALSAALDDSRFRQLGRDEPGIEIEISVLGPFRRIAGAGGFRLGEHGAWLEAGSRRGLLLPQVAEDRRWMREEFLDALAHKAGLRRGAWREPSARLSVFRAQVFGGDLLS
jgi:MEMO1 family protein